MPDGTNFRPTPDLPLVSPQDDALLEALDAVIARLSDRNRWTKHTAVKIFPSRPAAFCLVGAVNDVGRGRVELMRDLMREIATTIGSGSWGREPRYAEESRAIIVITFNDRSCTRHADVLTILRRTRDRLASAP